MREVFRKARQAAPCIVFFDEIDALVPGRAGGGSDSHVTERVISQFLTELDGIEELKGVLVLGATNRPDLLDPRCCGPAASTCCSRSRRPTSRTARRSSRSGSGQAARRRHPHRRPGRGLPDSFTGADIQGAVNRAALDAIREAVEAAEKKSKSAEKATVLIRREHMEQAIRNVRAGKGAR